MADPAFRASSNAAAQTASTFSVNKPVGTTDGVLLVAFQGTSVGVGTPPAAPSGWSMLGTRQSYNSGGGDLVCWYKVASSESASWTFNNATGGVSPSSNVYVAAFSGPPASPPEGSSRASGSSTTADPGSYTTLLPNEVVFVAWSITSNVGETITPDGTFTALGSIGDFSSKLNVGYKTQAAAGATSSTSATLSGTIAWGALLAAIAPTGTGGVSPTTTGGGQPITVIGDSGSGGSGGSFGGTSNPLNSPLLRGGVSGRRY